VAGSCEYGDEPSGSDATELVCVCVYIYKQMPHYCKEVAQN
jgi:hypothetical protein